LRTWGRKAASKSRITAAYDVVVTNDTPPVVLLGLEMQEIHGIDILLFSSRSSKSTGYRAIGFSLRAFKGDTAFDRVPGSRSC
jgi:hypothetical protein